MKENLFDEYPINMLTQLLGKTEEEIRSMENDELLNEILDKLKELENNKQDLLVSGENIKTINGNSLLGKGNIDIEGGSGTLDYNDLSSKPQIEGVELEGNKTLNDLNIQPKGDYVTKTELSSVTPSIGENGNWFINGEDTGNPSKGADGVSLGEIALVQSTGEDENSVMSQKAVTSKLTELGNKTSSVGYVACTTAAATAAKTITLTGVTALTTGIRLLVKMSNNNTATNATLNINSLGAKPLYYNNVRVSGDNAWEAGEVIEVYYDGTNFYSSNVLGGAGGGGNMILEWDTDVATTRNQVKQADRKAGMQISYNHPDNGWTNEQYIGTLFTDTYWGRDDMWDTQIYKKVFDAKVDRVVSSFIADGSQNPIYNPTTKILDLGRDCLFVINNKTYQLNNASNNPNNNHRNIELNSSSSAGKLYFNLSDYTFRAVNYSDASQKLDEYLVGAYRRKSDSIIIGSFPFNIETGTFFPYYNVSLIPSSKGNPCLDLSTMTLDMGENPLVVIGGKSYDLRALDTEGTEFYRKYSLNGGGGSGAQNIYFNLTDYSIFCDSYLLDYTKKNNAVLIGSIRRNGLKSIVNFAFSVDIKQKGGNGDYYRNFDTHIRSINHRGYTGYGATENTLQAFRDSKIYGFNCIETDLKVTSDGVVVLMHDMSINRTCTMKDGNEIEGTINVADTTYNDLTTLYKPRTGDEPIPTLEEAVKLCKQIGLDMYFDSGLDEEGIKNAIEIVQKYRMQKHVSFIGDMSELTSVKNLDEKIRLGYLTAITEESIQELLTLKTNENDIFMNDQVVNEDKAAICQKYGVDMETWGTPIESLPLYTTGYTHDSVIAGRELMLNHLN